MSTLTLTATEQELCQRSSETRTRKARGARAVGKAGQRQERARADDLRGVTAELAAARLLDLYPLGVCSSWQEEVGRNDGHDLSHRIDVKGSAQPWLLVRPHEPEELRYLAAQVTGWSVRLLGWLPGEEAKQERWLEEPAGRPPAFIIREPFLRSVDSLEELVIRETMQEAGVRWERVMGTAWCQRCRKAWAVRKGRDRGPLCGACWLEDWKLGQQLEAGTLL